jgi:mono/diheme cytochrome c family protein
MRNFMALVLVLGWPVFSASPASAGDRIDYLRQIKPIFASRCFACHGALKQEAGLRLDAAFEIRAGGDSGAAIVPGKNAESLLVAKIAATDDSRMPPEGEPLSAEQIALVKSWIDAGAEAPDERLPPNPRDHWSFRPPVKVAIPSAAAVPPVNAIDAFLDDQQRRQGLHPLPPAAKHVLLRRVYLDLVGLPPTRQELHAFLADESPTAYESVVDRLLASPQYGERWGRHWMDIWRYSDWFGLRKEARYSQRHIWHWRDWIIESLNSDKPYDRMIEEMLAADELAPDDPQALRALGYLGRNWYLFNRNVWLDNIVEHTGRGFLGLTVQCCRCHDHKFDPISQIDYYRLRAFFEPHRVRTDRLPGQPDLTLDGLPRVYDEKLDAQTFLFVRGAEEHPDTEHPLAPGVPAVLADGKLEIAPVKLPLAAWYPDLRPFAEQQLIGNADSAFTQAANGLLGPPPATVAAEKQYERGVAAGQKQLALLQAEAASLRARVAAENAKYAEPPDPKAAELAAVAAIAERRAKLAAAELQLLNAEQKLAVLKETADSEGLIAKADASKAIAAKTDAPTADAQLAAAKKRETDLAAAEKAVSEARTQIETAQSALQNPGTAYAPIGTVYPSTSSGRRLALARWIANRKNPLTARVAVNHIWARHFGEPIVGSMFDFGLRTRQPELQPLLDWLAVEFMDSGWSMKRLHRLMVTSNAYRRSSGGEADDANVKIDQDNHFYWRMNTKRMEAEVVRDSLLHLGEALDPAIGGRDLAVDTAESTSRRTLYYRFSRDDQIKFLSMFDGPSVEECYRRQSTIVPQQALVLVNGRMTMAAAARIAAVIAREVEQGQTAAADGNRAFVASAFERILGRPPADAERAECEQTLARLEAVFRGKHKPGESPRQKARENLVHVLVNHNDFVTIR